ncbi:hypothetical protein AGMMS50229_15300 [Campylobacterota bacterium]|nr:hypothetical protein AGMMS50229_15300 [Campylobacterota bacterium]
MYSLKLFAFVLAFVLAFVFAFALPLAAANYKNSELPITKIALFSSGVGYFVQEGTLDGSVKLTLPFHKDAMDDVLKSLTLYDEAAGSVLVDYPSEETLAKTLENIKINLSGNPSTEQILVSLRGAEVEIATHTKIVGKIVGVEKRQSAKEGAAITESFLTLFSDSKLISIPIAAIASYHFTDKAIGDELANALAFILSSHGANRRDLSVYIDAAKTRTARLGYVIAQPVWKANYRLDLAAKKPFLQGWAIVDNTSESDWKSVELSLIVGRPVSFRQPYYAAHFVDRELLPLSIAGTAKAESFASGFAENESAKPMMMRAKAFEAAEMADDVYASHAVPAPIASNYQTASASAAGEQFAFTLKDKITLAARQSAMIPLVSGAIEARKLSILSAARVANRTPNPALGVELTNSTGMKLPAGSVSLYDGGIYAGDALLEFLPLGEKRLISYGDDLSVIASATQTNANHIDKVKVHKGVMAIESKIVYTKSYNLKNSANEAKTIVIEHPFLQNAKLIEPAKTPEKTDSLYRFETQIAAGGTAKFVVIEEARQSSTVAITGVPFKSLAIYASSESYPKEVRDSFKRAEKLSNALTAIETLIKQTEQTISRKSANEDRVRQNIMALGNESALSKTYIGELAALEEEIGSLSKTLDTLNADRVKAQAAYDDFIAKMEI